MDPRWTCSCPWASPRRARKWRRSQPSRPLPPRRPALGFAPARLPHARRAPRCPRPVRGRVRAGAGAVSFGRGAGVRGRRRAGTCWGCLKAGVPKGEGTGFESRVPCPGPGLRRWGSAGASRAPGGPQPQPQPPRRRGRAEDSGTLWVRSTRLAWEPLAAAWEREGAGGGRPALRLQRLPAPDAALGFSLPPEWKVGAWVLLRVH